MGKLFGTDGVRGVANEELTPELAFDIGKAGMVVLTKERKNTPKILVGLDTRLSGDMLESALVAGLCSLGAIVCCAGIIPTPAIAFLVRRYGMDAGVMISASHNPFQDNGIKFFSGDGYKLPDALEDEIEDIIEKGTASLPRPTGQAIGYKMPCEDAVNDYLKFLESTLASFHKGESGTVLEGLKIALDCANGATYQVAPLIFEQLGAQVSVIHNEPDGMNINSDCGSTHMESLVSYVKENGMDIGFAFDGDGDRCLAVDENGILVDGDVIMAILGMHLKSQGKLTNDTIVTTVMSNLGLRIMAQRNQIQLEITKVGDRYVLEKMLRDGHQLGGEQSGHVIMLEYNTTGDGVLTALHTAAILKQSGKPFSELSRIVEIMPQVLCGAKVSNARKSEYTTHAVIQNEIQQMEAKYADTGRILIRPSGTEPLVRVLLEGSDLDEMTQDAEYLVTVFEKYLN